MCTSRMDLTNRSDFFPFFFLTSYHTYLSQVNGVLLSFSVDFSIFATTIYIASCALTHTKEGLCIRNITVVNSHGSWHHLLGEVMN